MGFNSWSAVPTDLEAGGQLEIYLLMDVQRTAGWLTNRGTWFPSSAGNQLMMGPAQGDGSHGPPKSRKPNDRAAHETRARAADQDPAARLWQPHSP